MIYDFGTRHDESFYEYIVRLEEEIDKYLEEHGTMSPILVSKIVEIFKDACFFNHYKLSEIEKLLTHHLKRPSTVGDYNIMVEYIRERLTKKTERKTLSHVLKQLT